MKLRVIGEINVCVDKSIDFAVSSFVGFIRYCTQIQRFQFNQYGFIFVAGNRC